MGYEMDNIATKPLSWYDGSVNGLTDQQTFNINHIYLHIDLVWFYSQEYMVETPEILTIQATNIYNTEYVTVSSIVNDISIINLSTPQT